MTYPAKYIGISINKPVQAVYNFTSNPENLPKWAAGLSGSIKKVGDNWIAESPMGSVKVKFTEKNSFGVLDHDVILPSGDIIHNPMRAYSNGDGCEVVFTLYKLSEMSDEEFAQDAKLVETDLLSLKEVIENEL